MKNKDILLDVIGDADEKLVPDITEEKKKSHLKWITLGGVCAAAAIGCAVLLPKGNAPLTPPAPSQVTTAPTAAQPDRDIYCLALAAYPDMPHYPEDGNDTAYKKWHEARMKLRDQPADYMNGFDTFFENSTKVFLTDAGSDNRVYSPLSLYMALGMSAEITDGTTRKQILDLLCQDDIQTLRSRANSIWEANYTDDGMARCVLASSLWLNDSYPCNMDTVRTTAKNYYSSIYHGDPADEFYSTMMQNWMNNSTDGLLTDYISHLKMDPQMTLTLASTVNYSGKWRDQFNKEMTAPASFHASDGDIQCEFMNAERLTTYFWGSSFGAVSLPLENNGQMRLLLPDEGISPEELINDGEVIDYLMNNGLYSSSKLASVSLSVPKFDVSSDIDLKEGLESLGVRDIFSSDKADFTPLSENSDGIALSEARQDTRVLIDEEGCKAASLTAMVYAGGAAEPEDHIDFVLDRPFVFEIMSETGLPLFVGIVNRPVQ